MSVLAGIAAMSTEAGENAGLLKKLVEKGVITEGEAAVLAEEANSEFNNSMPSWVNSLTLKETCAYVTSKSIRIPPTRWAGHVVATVSVGVVLPL